MVPTPQDSAAPAPPPPTAAAPLVFRGVTVIDVRTGRRRPLQTVLIVGSRIRALGSAGRVRVPNDARVIDAGGKYLIPGLWDMHVHQFFCRLSKDCSDVSMRQRWEVSRRLLLANGVTGVREAGWSTVPLATLGQWKRAVAAGVLVGPRLYVGGPALHGDSADRRPQAARFADRAEITVTSPAEVRMVVDSLQAAGADFIKPYFLHPELYFAVLAEARRIGLPFGGHGAYKDGQWDPSKTGVSGLAISDSGARFLDHGPWLFHDVCGLQYPDSLNVAQCAAAGQRFRRNGTWVVAGPVSATDSPTPDPAGFAEQLQRYLPLPSSVLASQAALDRTLAKIRSQPGFDRPRPASLADWVAAVRATDSSALRRAALFQYFPILAGSDAGFTPTIELLGFVLHDVLATYVARGLMPLAALQTATLNPALALQATDSLGTIAVGKLADLVLLDADPLADIWNTRTIRAVVANGRYYDRAALDRLLAEAEQAAHR